jgi:tetratricopeptide (TPR) repeat protein
MNTTRTMALRVSTPLTMLAALLLAAGVTTPALAQWPPQRLENLKVLPQDISVRSLVDTMAGFTRALGVRCTYCHVGSEAIPLGQYNFVIDSLAPKNKAREMMRMVLAINNNHLANISDRRSPAIVVTCATCHRGVAQPRPIQQVLMMAYDAGGADSLEKSYRALRERYYGSAAYDFGEVPLADVAAVLQTRAKLPDALRLYKLNMEFLPRSTFALRQAAAAEMAAGDTTSAVADLQRALEINPKDDQAKNSLDRLRKKP